VRFRGSRFIYVLGKNGLSDREKFSGLLRIEFRGGFYYLLRGVEKFENREPEIWMRTLQAPLRVRLGWGLFTGMVLSMFGD
jgi:hypothetical protein